MLAPPVEGPTRQPTLETILAPYTALGEDDGFAAALCTLFGEHSETMRPCAIRLRLSEHLPVRGGLGSGVPPAVVQSAGVSMGDSGANQARWRHVAIITPAAAGCVLAAAVVSHCERSRCRDMSRFCMFVCVCVCGRSDLEPCLMELGLVGQHLTREGDTLSGLSCVCVCVSSVRRCSFGASASPHVAMSCILLVRVDIPLSCFVDCSFLCGVLFVACCVDLFPYLAVQACRGVPQYVCCVMM